MERSSVDSSHFRHCLYFCCGVKISVDGLEEGHVTRTEEGARAIRNNPRSSRRALEGIGERRDSSRSRRSVGICRCAAMRQVQGRHPTG